MTSKVYIQNKLLSALKTSIKNHMPPGTFRDFFSWAISPKNPKQALWIKILGIPQLSNLTHYLLEDCVDEALKADLLAHSALLNVYLCYEVISDNFAIGIMRWTEPDNGSVLLQRHALRVFNSAMIKKLGDFQLSTIELLDPLQKIINASSLFEHSLCAAKQQEVVQEYSKANKYLLNEIEHGGWAALVANIETCSGALENLKDNPIYDLLQESLKSRYKAGNASLSRPDLPLCKLIRLGTSTILVEAVLLYYYGVLAHLKGLETKLDAVIQSNLVQQVAMDAALLVRLLNDLGTPILESNGPLIARIQNRLRREYRQMNKEATIFDLLLSAGKDIPELTRLYKDLQYGEFNIILGNLRAENTPVAIDEFGSLLKQSAIIYQNHYERLLQNVEILQQEMGESTFGDMALHFVIFHETLYGNAHDKNEGEYAV